MRLIELDLTALAHHGLVTCESSGLTRSAWYRALAAGTIEQLHPGVARLVGTPTTYRQRIAAATLAAAATPSTRRREHPDRPRPVVVLASHRSAASLWLGDVDPRSPTPTGRATDSKVSLMPVDITMPTRSGRRQLTGVALHRPTDRRRLVPAKVDGIRCTNILRTLVDLGSVAPDHVHPLLGHALSTGQVDIAAVQTVLVEHGRPGRGGVGALRSALADWSIDAKPADSALELAFDRLVRRFDLPPAEFHPMVEGWEIDFRFTGTRVLVECDGWTSHGLQRDQFERDRRRDADLIAAGWVVSRHTYRAITKDSARTAQRLRRILAATTAP